MMLKQRQENIIFTFTLGKVVTVTCPALKDLLSTTNTLSIGARFLDILAFLSLSKRDGTCPSTVLYRCVVTLSRCASTLSL
jgi:hypothetical protein